MMCPPLSHLQHGMRPDKFLLEHAHWPRQRHCLLSHPGEPCRFNTCVQSSLDCCLVLRSMKLKSQNLIETNILCLQGLRLRNRTQMRDFFIIYGFFWTGRTDLSMKGRTWTWPHVSVDTSSSSSVWYWKYQPPQPFPIAKSEHMQLITSHYHHFSNREVNWWHHEANFIKHGCQISLPVF